MNDNFPIDRLLFFQLLAFTGIRKGEILALTWSDINFKDNHISITKTLTVGDRGRLLVNAPKTKNSIIKIILDDDSITLLKEWKKEQFKILNRLSKTISMNQLIFPGTDNQLMQLNVPGEWLKTIYRHIAKKESKVLKKIIIHGFRHTHCSLLFEAGATIKEVQDRLGHSDIKTTMNIYAHLTHETKTETVNKFSDFMKNDTRGIQKGIQKGSSY